MLPKENLPKSYVDRINTTPQCESFMHLHLGFDAEVSNFLANANPGSMFQIYATDLLARVQLTIFKLSY